MSVLKRASSLAGRFFVSLGGMARRKEKKEKKGKMGVEEVRRVRLDSGLLDLE